MRTALKRIIRKYLKQYRKNLKTYRKVYDQKYLNEIYKEMIFDLKQFNEECGDDDYDSDDAEEDIIDAWRIECEIYKSQHSNEFYEYQYCYE